MNALLWFVAGFLTRAAISYASDLMWRWRMYRLINPDDQLLSEYLQKERPMQWKVKAVGIEWDVGDPDDYDPATYHPENLPSEFEVIVTGDDEAEAIERGLNDISDLFGFLIADTEAVHVELLKRRRTD